MRLFGFDITSASNFDIHSGCRVTARSLEQQRDSAIAIAEQFAQANLRLAGEVVRLSQHNTPVVPEGEVDQPKSTRDRDHEAGIELNDPENLRRPKPGPARVDE